jgi:hypothetical protein
LTGDTRAAALLGDQIDAFLVVLLGVSDGVLFFRLGALSPLECGDRLRAVVADERSQAD